MPLLLAAVLGKWMFGGNVFVIVPDPQYMMLSEYDKSSYDLKNGEGIRHRRASRG